MATSGSNIESVAGNPVDTGIGTAGIATQRVALDSAQFGAAADTAATSDAGTFSFIALFKRLLQKFTTQFPAALTAGGLFKTALYDSADNGLTSDITKPGPTARGLVVRQVEDAPATFSAFYDRIVPAANKYMAVLFNTSGTRKVVVQRVYAIPTQIAAAAGKEMEQTLITISARTAGTAVTPTSRDSADSLSAGITADHASTVVTDVVVLRRFILSNDNISYNSAVLVDMLAMPSNWIIYQRLPGTKGITLRQNQGLAIKNITNDTAGTHAYVYEFTDEPA